MSSLTYGKYNGMLDTEVAAIDPQYILWAAENVKDSKVSPEAMAKAVQTLDRGDHWDYDDDSIWIETGIDLSGRCMDDYGSLE